MGGRGSGGRTGQYFTWNKKLFPGIGAGMKRGTTTDSNEPNGAGADNGKYDTFKDDRKAGFEGGWEYKGSGASTVKWFDNYSNYDELIRSMSEDDRFAFKRIWAPGQFMGVHDGWDALSDKFKGYQRIFDKYLDRSELRRGVVLSRTSDAQLLLGKGHKLPTLSELQSMEGKVITSKSPMSFAAAKRGLTIGDNSKKVEYKLSIPSGTKGAGMWIGDSRINGWGPRQREFMANRDVAIKVGKTTYNPSTGIYTVELKYVGRLKHDYGKKRR